MMFEKVKGQDNAIAILKKAVDDGKLSHSYLFLGPDGVGKYTTALYFGMAVNCLEDMEKRPCGVCTSCKKISSFNHSDIIYIFPSPNYDISPTGEIKDNKHLNEYESYLENKRNTPWKAFFFEGNTAIRLDCIRMVQHRINLSRVEGRYKVIIIEKADQMNVNAANAFLKTLEEPPDDVIIILTSSKYEAMLPTIISRCQKISFHKISRKIIEDELFYYSGNESAENRMFSRIADGNLEKALNILDARKSETRARMNELVSIILKGDDLKFIPFSEKYKSFKTVSELSEIIRYLIIWLGDVVFCAESPEEIVNIDMVEEMENVVANNPYIVEQAGDLIVYLENMLKRIEGNVNPHLIIIDIYNRLKNCLSV